MEWQTTVWVSWEEPEAMKLLEEHPKYILAAEDTIGRVYITKRESAGLEEDRQAVVDALERAARRRGKHEEENGSERNNGDHDDHDR